MNTTDRPLADPQSLPDPHTVGRRQFLFAAGAFGFGLSSVARTGDAATVHDTVAHDFADFEPIEATVADRLLVPNGFTFDVVASFGDEIGKDAAGAPVHCGAACDFTAFLPDRGSPQQGTLFVNHEYPEEVGLGGKPVVLGKAEKPAAQIAAEQRSVGFSRMHVARAADGSWHVVRDAKRARRVDATQPAIEVVGPARGLVGQQAIGSLGNCSGGVSPWATFSCEENYQNYFRRGADYNYGWTTEQDGARRALGYGWVVEVPHDPELPMRKHTALGRFRHENVAIHCVAGEPLVVYMGDDSKDQHLYKFVSEDSCVAPESPSNGALLERGTLYVADVKHGAWLPIDLAYWQTADQDKYQRATKVIRERLKAEKLPKGDDEPITQAEALTFPDAVAKVLGATPLDRPEDCEIGPDGGVYIALTNNDAHGNFWGSIARLEELAGPSGRKFSFAHLVHGSEQLKFACPDNLCFDPAGDLWFTTDRAEDDMGKPVYAKFGNNGLFRMRRVPTAGGSSGPRYAIEQFCSAPVDAELTGPTFTPDGSTLFLSVQHPGICAKVGESTSHWPAAGPDPNATGSATNIARSAVVAIRRLR